MPTQPSFLLLLHRCSGVDSRTPSQMRRDTGKAKGEGHEIQPDDLKILEELLGHNAGPGID